MKKQNQTSEPFLTIPNKFIQCNIENKFNMGREFYVIYLLISKNRSALNLNQSYLTIKDVLDFYGIKKYGGKKPQVYYSIINILTVMIKNNMIEIDMSLDELNNVKYNSCIRINICDKFTVNRDYTKLNRSQINYIFSDERFKSNRNLLTCYLYIISHINDTINNENTTDTVLKCPNAFWGSIQNMSYTLCINTRTITNCIKCLVTPTPDKPALLIKEKTKNWAMIPNIYVINKPGYEKEIEFTINYLDKIYHTKVKTEN